MTTDNFRFYLQNRLIQTRQTGGQWYSDTYPLVFPAITNISDANADNNAHANSDADADTDTDTDTDTDADAAAAAAADNDDGTQRIALQTTILQTADSSKLI
jgi:hypothetical protein